MDEATSLFVVQKELLGRRFVAGVEIRVTRSTMTWVFQVPPTLGEFARSAIGTFRKICDRYGMRFAGTEHRVMIGAEFQLNGPPGPETLRALMHPDNRLPIGHNVVSVIPVRPMDGNKVQVAFAFAIDETALREDL